MKHLLKKTLLAATLLCVGTNAWADAVTIGLTQAVTNDGDTHTVGDASYTGINTDVVVESSIGSSCGYGEFKSSGNYRTVTVGSPEVTYTAYKIFRKTENSTAFSDNQYIGFTMTVAAGKKVTLTNLNAEFWSSDATMTWKVNVLNSIGTSIYETSTTQNNSNKTGSFSVAAPTGLTNLVAGTYTIKLQMYQAGGNKYFVVPRLTFDATVEDDTTPKYTITANVAEGQSSYGSIDKAGDNIVVEGSSISITAAANEGYGFINWTDGNGDEVSTNETLTLTDVTADATYTANFKQAVQVKYSGTYRGTLGSRQFVTYRAANGINEIYANGQDIYTIPSYAHKYNYREGYRFNKWAPVGDGVNRLNSGDEYDVNNATITDNKITLDPSFTANTKTLAAALGSLTSETTVNWPLGVSSIVFRDWQTDDAYGYYTQATNLDGEVFDIPMTITSNGKIANYTRTDAMCQTNQNVKFTLPAVKGMIVTISGAYKAFKADGKTATTVAGSTEYTLSNSNKTLEYTYEGEASTIDIVMGDDAEYITEISVTYPRITKTITLNSSGYATYSNDHDVEVSGAKAYTAELDFATPKITCHEITSNKIPAGNGVLLYGDAGATVTLSYTTGAAALSNNNLKATTDSEGNLASKTEGRDYYALSGNTFMEYTGDTFVHNKAYFEVEGGTVLAREMTISFDGVTGIDKVENGEVKSSLPAKRIVNGNLVIEKGGQMFNANGQLVK